jgi:L-lactate dehydrogenase complex protein LldG
MTAPPSSRESGDRRSFLARVEKRSNLPTTPHLINAATKDDAAGGVAYTADLSDLVASFVAAARRHESVVYVVHSDAEHLAAVLDIAANFDVEEFFVSEETTAREFGDLLAQAGATVHPVTNPRRLSERDTVVTAAAAGVALTGSIAVSSGALGSRLLTTVPKNHIAVVAATSIVATPREVYQGFAEGRWPGSALTIATGPSRTGDIEMELTLGVHGPGHVVIVVDARP